MDRKPSSREHIRRLLPYLGCGLLVGLTALLILRAGLATLAWMESDVKITGHFRPTPEMRAGHCRSNLAAIGHGLSAYRVDFDDHCPPPARWYTSLDTYASDLVWTCRSDMFSQGYQTNSHLGGARFSDIADPAETLVAWDAGATVPKHTPVPGARNTRHSVLDNFLLADGAVKPLPSGNAFRVDP